MIIDTAPGERFSFVLLSLHFNDDNGGDTFKLLQLSNNNNSDNNNIRNNILNIKITIKTIIIIVLITIISLLLYYSCWHCNICDKYAHVCEGDDDDDVNKIFKLQHNFLIYIYIYI